MSGAGVYTQTANGSKGGYATTTLKISNRPSPSASLMSTASTPEINGAGAGAQVVGADTTPGQELSLMLYSVELLGPTGAVPIKVNARSGASLSPPAFDNPGANALAEAFLVVASGSGGREFSDQVYLQASPPALASGYTHDYAGNYVNLSYRPTTGKLSEPLRHLGQRQHDGVSIR